MNIFVDWQSVLLSFPLWCEYPIRAGSRFHKEIAVVGVLSVFEAQTVQVGLLTCQTVKENSFDIFSVAAGALSSPMNHKSIVPFFCVLHYQQSGILKLAPTHWACHRTGRVLLMPRPHLQAVCMNTVSTLRTLRITLSLQFFVAYRT
jgi:hypothetical protein